MAPRAEPHSGRLLNHMHLLNHMLNHTVGVADRPIDFRGRAQTTETKVESGIPVL